MRAREITQNPENAALNSLSLEASRNMEEYRVRIASQVAKHDNLWDLAVICADELNIDSVDREKFVEAPKDKYIDKISSSRYFARLEKKLSRIKGELSDRVYGDLNSLVDGVYSQRDEISLKNQNLVLKALSTLGVTERRKNYSDLAQEGRISLLDSSHSFDYKFGYVFSTFAFRSIQLDLIDILATKRSIHIPSKVARQMAVIKKELRSRDLELESLTERDREELSQSLLMDKSEFEDYIGFFKLGEMTSLDKPLRNSKDGTNFNYAEKIEDPRGLDFAMDLIRYERVYRLKKELSSKLPSRVLQMLELKLEGNTSKEVGELFGITYQRVNQLFNKYGLAASSL